jgi:hypothetical protein
VSSGEKYPLNPEQDSYGIVDTIVQYPGTNYSTNDTAIDNLGTIYKLTIENGTILSATPLNTVEVTDTPIITINSKTGSGAVLKPVFASITQLSGITQTSIDCPN